VRTACLPLLANQNTLSSESGSHRLLQGPLVGDHGGFSLSSAIDFLCFVSIFDPGCVLCRSRDVIIAIWLMPRVVGIIAKDKTKIHI